jgi:DNA-binding transcriptional ArsR family regulator
MRIAKEDPLSEFTLRRYERPKNVKGRELVKKLCLSLGLLQPGDSRDIIIDILHTLLLNRELKCSDIEKKVIDYREKNNLPVFGVASSNIRRQLKRLRELYLIEKKGRNYRIMNNAPLTETFEDNTQPNIDNSVKRLKDYLSAVDREFNFQK